MKLTICSVFLIPLVKGSLRYSVPDSDDWLSASNEVPPIIELKRLLFASNEIARGNERNGQIKELLDAGSGSLGGARPKASVVDEGKLLLAKFSHPGDEWDVIAWEKTALDIAGAAGMAVPSSKLVRIGGDSALLLERFDRSGSLEKGERIPYLSAMSLIGAYDGEHCDYTTVADALSVWTSSPSCELTELFRRVVFSVALHNTDDHLRNLGLIRKKSGMGVGSCFRCQHQSRCRAGPCHFHLWGSGKKRGRGLGFVWRNLRTVS